MKKVNPGKSRPIKGGGKSAGQTISGNPGKMASKVKPMNMGHAAKGGKC